jgi:hypothetical protein
MKGKTDRTEFRAKSAKDAKVRFDNQKWYGRGLCELSVLGARELLAVVLANISEVRIQGQLAENGGLHSPVSRSGK